MDIVDITIVFMGFTNDLTTRGPHIVGNTRDIYIYIHNVSLRVCELEAVANF